MRINASHSLEGVAHVCDRWLKRQSADIQGVLSDMTLNIGLANDPDFRTPAAARDCLYVGDGAHIGELIATPAVKQLYETDPKSVVLTNRWNAATNKWDILARAKPRLAADAEPDLIQSQLYAPWTIGYFQNVFDKPLLYSKASKLVKVESGSNPWCEIMNLYTADYGGTAMSLAGAGAVENNMTKDVTVTSGMMSGMVMNMYVTYSLTLEEQEQAKSRDGNPFGQSMIARKQKYADYVLQVLTDYLTYYGCAETSTDGLMNIATVIDYQTIKAGHSMAQVAAQAGLGTRGAELYRNLSTVLNEFFGSTYNKFPQVKIAMSTEAYNVLRSVPYSDTYDPSSLLEIFQRNYNGGETKGGSVPTVEFFADPMLDAETEFNADKADLMVVAAPEIGTGTEDTNQKVILQGMPLKKFVYPVIPGMINTQHRMLRRYAGIFAPIDGCVKVYKGFGAKHA